MRFEDWKDAHKYAQWLANDTRLDVAIRAVKEFGRMGYNTSYASRNDSDYAKAEIVSPNNA
jgi:hypothetical protein